MNIRSKGQQSLIFYNGNIRNNLLIMIHLQYITSSIAYNFFQLILEILYLYFVLPIINHYIDLHNHSL
jgi:hypothetical protein